MANPNSKQQPQQGNMDYWILKLDRKGKIQWQKTFGGNYADLLRTVTPTADGGFVVGGYSNSSQTGDKTSDNYGEGGDFWVLKLNAEGAILWQQTIGGDHDDQLTCVAQTHDGGLLFGGNSNSGASNSKSQNATDGTDFWIYKTDQSGNPLWQKIFNYGAVDILTSMVVNADQSILLGGCSPTPNTTKNRNTDGQDDYIALKISDKGETLWERKVGSKGLDMLRKVIETRDGGYLMAGTSTPAHFNGNNNANTNGNSNDKISGFEQTENQQLKNAKDQLNAELQKQVAATNIAIKNNLDAASKKAKDLLGLKDYSPVNLAPNANALQIGDLLGGGNSTESQAQARKPLPRSGDQSLSYGNTDFWVVKLRDRNKPAKEKALIEAMPNPAATFTNIIVGYDFTEGTATVVDLAGHTLARFAVTSRTIPVDLSTLAEGIYVVNVATDKGNESVKVIKSSNKK